MVAAAAPVAVELPFSPRWEPAEREPVPAGPEPVSPELVLVSPPEERQRLLDELPELDFDEWVVRLRRAFDEHAAEEAAAAARVSRRRRLVGVAVALVGAANAVLPLALMLTLAR